VNTARYLDEHVNETPGLIELSLLILDHTGWRGPAGERKDVSDVTNQDDDVRTELLEEFQNGPHDLPMVSWDVDVRQNGDTSAVRQVHRQNPSKRQEAVASVQIAEAHCVSDRFAHDVFVNVS